MKSSIDVINISIMSGVEDGKVYEFEKDPIIIGRHSTDDVNLAYDSRVSRHHARISKDGNIYYVEDVGPEWRGSKTGTFVKDIRIDKKTAITSGELILIGNVWIKFETKCINKPLQMLSESR